MIHQLVNIYRHLLHLCTQCKPESTCRPASARPTVIRSNSFWQFGNWWSCDYHAARQTQRKMSWRPCGLGVTTWHGLVIVGGSNDGYLMPGHMWSTYLHHDNTCPVSACDVIKWKYFPRYWPLVRGIHRSPGNSPHKGQWRGALMFSLICAWINGWVNNREAGDLRRHRAHCDVTVMEGFVCRLFQLRHVSLHIRSSLHGFSQCLIFADAKNIPRRMSCFVIWIRYHRCRRIHMSIWETAGDDIQFITQNTL